MFLDKAKFKTSVYAPTDMLQFYLENVQLLEKAENQGNVCRLREQKEGMFWVNIVRTQKQS